MNRPYKILVIDDDPDFYDTFFASDTEWERINFTPKEGSSGFGPVFEQDFDAIFLDLEIPNVSSYSQGIKYLNDINQELKNTKPIIVVTKEPNVVDTYQKVLNHGAAGFFPKGKYNRIICQQLTRKIIEQFQPIPQSSWQVFSQSIWLQKKYDSFLQILKEGNHVFTILGEIGTGKQFLIKYLKKYVSISLISIHAQDFKTKLNTKAENYKAITEIETANEETQEILEQWIKKKPKVIFLCDDRIKQAYLNGQLSPNLYALIMQNVVKIPSLVERPNDIEPFVDLFLQDPRNCPRHLEFFGKKATQVFTQEALIQLKQHKWEGNVRELRSVIQRGICQADMDDFGANELKKIEVNLLAKRIKEDDYRHIAKIETWSYEKIRADQRLKEIEQICINEATIPEIAVELNCKVDELVNELREYKANFPEFFDHKNMISKWFKVDFTLFMVFHSHPESKEIAGNLKTHLDPVIKKRNIIFDNVAFDILNTPPSPKKEFRKVDLFLFLLCPHFLKSEQIRTEFIDVVIQENANVIPIIIRTCLWEDDKIFEKLQILPRNKKPVSEFENQDQVLKEITLELRNYLEKKFVII